MACCIPPKQREAKTSLLPIHLPHQVQYIDRVGDTVQVLLSQGGTLSLQVSGMHHSFHEEVIWFQWDEHTRRLHHFSTQNSYDPDDVRSFSPIPASVDVSWIRALAEAAHSPKCEWKVVLKPLPQMVFPYRVLTTTGDLHFPDSRGSASGGADESVVDCDSEEGPEEISGSYATRKGRKLEIQKAVFVVEHRFRVRHDSEYSDHDSEDDDSDSNVAGWANT